MTDLKTSHGLQVREEKMKEKRKQTPFREYLKEIASWSPLVFHKNNGMISKYPPVQRLGKVIPNKEHQELRDNFSKSWLDYDFSISFFENLQKLFSTVPFSHMRNENSENCEFADVVINSKNAYLSSTVISGSENVLYCFSVKDNSKNIFNSVMVWDNSENVYFCTGIFNSFNIFYSKFLINCSNIRFSTNLMWCHDCILCNDLENKSYCIKNQEYSKEEYQLKKQELLKDKNHFSVYYDNLSKRGNNFGSTNVEGDLIFKSENIKNGNLCYNVKDGRNLILVWSRDGAEHIYDCFTWWSPYGLDFYGVMGAWAAENIYNVTYVDFGATNIYYSCDIISCSYCIWCVGLKNKQFCILNKEYSKEERFELANKIFTQMGKDWILGQFFPWWMNPFYFNDTAACLIDDSFTKEEVAKAGYLRRDGEIKVDIPQWADVVETQNLASYEWFDEQWNRQINPDILKKVIKDEKWNYYRIVKMEYDFLMKHALPLPELHRLERIKLGFKFK